MLLREDKWLSRLQMRPESERKWRSNEVMVSDTKIGNYRMTTNWERGVDMGMEVKLGGAGWPI